MVHGFKKQYSYIYIQKIFIRFIILILYICIIHSTFINSNVVCLLYYCNVYCPLWLVIVYTPLIGISNPIYVVYKPDI